MIRQGRYKGYLEMSLWNIKAIEIRCGDLEAVEYEVPAASESRCLLDGDP
jgi:hypothetical protein